MSVPAIPSIPDMPALPVAAAHEAETARIEALLDSQPWGTVALGRTDGEHRVVVASKRAQQMLGRPIAPGATLMQVFGTLSETLAGGGATSDERLCEALETGLEVAIGETCLWLKLAYVAPAESTRALAPGAIDATVALIDVTGLRRGLDERIASLRFLSHDLRSPLNSISALSQLAESDAPAFEQCGGMEQIGRLARYALALGENFIFSSVLGNLRRNDFSRFDLRATVRELVPQLEVAAVYRRVLLRLWLPDDSAVWIEGVRSFAARALQNLVDNAIQASRPGSTVTVLFKVSDGHAEIQVSDQAGGLPGLRAKGRIEHFDAQPNRSSKGFGLGLKLAWQIVGMHGGTLHAEPNDEAGTTFVMRLPCLTAGSNTTASVHVFKQGAR
jgi:signal transduction histidine kinase